MPPASGNNNDLVTLTRDGLITFIRDGENTFDYEHPDIRGNTAILGGRVTDSNGHFRTPDLALFRPSGAGAINGAVRS